MFVYFWFPGFIFPALSLFAWMTWIAPDNFNLNMITGSQMGLGFNPISSFDWNVISTALPPLASPFFAFVQQFTGAVLAGFIIIALYYSNVSWAAYLPPNSSGIFDNTGNSYNISRILNPNSAIVNEAAYQEYSPTFYGAGNLVLYGAFFAFYPLTMVFIVLDMWRPILKAYRSMSSSAASSIKRFFVGLKDATSSLFRGNWPQLDTPVWTVFFVIGLNLVFLIPMSYLYPISGTTEGLNVVTELIVGYALPGHPEALMFVKAFGYNINGQADNYISDQKMGFYAKLPPRAMYRGQMFSAIITAFVAYGVVEWVDTSVEGICTKDQPAKFNCANGSQVYFSSSVVWVRNLSSVVPPLDDLYTDNSLL